MSVDSNAASVARECPSATLRLRTDKAALANNYAALDRMSAGASGAARAGAAIKADCYGLGVAQCLPTLKSAGARDFWVAHWQEVPNVLEHVPPQEVSVLHGLTSVEEARFAIATGVRPVINSLQQAVIWKQAGGGMCDVMVDTGINRLGLRPEEVSDPIVQSLKVVVLMSHLACADEDSAMNNQQLTDFLSVRGAISHREASLANSAGIALGADYAFDITRPGLALYGGVPRPEFEGVISQVAFPEAAIIQKRMLKAGEGVGYNAAFIAPADMPVGVVSLGYADGIARSWQSGKSAAFTYGDARLPMLGKISMDMIVIDLGEAPDLCEGDWVQLPYHLPDAAQQSGLSQYELLTNLGRRFAA